MPRTPKDVSSERGRSSTRASQVRRSETVEREPSRAQGACKPGDADRPRKPLAPGLYLVATPIGNAADISLRALDVLTRADLIACEDTRVTAKLLSLHGISNKRTAYHEHNADKARPILIEHLKSGESVALVSDAGTPMISDPGYRLVRDCREAGIAVTALPGPSSVIDGLVLSGLPTDRFLFAGFLPSKGSARRKVAQELSGVPATLVFMESPRRLADSLVDLAAVLGADREAAVARELTKLFEEVRNGTLGELAAHYAEAGGPKGEVVVIVGPPGAAEAPTEADLDERLRDAMTKHSLKEAAARVAAETGLAKRQVYSRALALKDADG